MKPHGKRQDTLCALLLTLIALALMLRAGYGFCWSDESFYLTFAQRLWNGQRLILDEWHPVQFYSALTYPILTLYRCLFGTEGIYLFARLVYVCFAWGVSLLTYFSLRRKTRPLAAFLCAGLVLGYSRGNIWGFSYYNLFLLLTVAAFCLLQWGREKGGLRILSGMALGFSVLCVPYFAAFLVPVLVYFLLRRESRKDALAVTLGICVSAAYFLIFFLPKDLGAVAENLAYILSDPEHDSGPTANLLAAVRDVKLLFYWEAGLVAISAALLLLGKRLLPGIWGVLPGLAMAFAGAALSLWRYRRGETGFALYPYALFTLPCVIWMMGKREQSRLSLALQLLGICMGLAMGLSSNTEAFSLIVGVLVYTMGVIVGLDGAKSRAVRFFSAALACLVLVLMLGSRFTTVFRDAPLEQLDTAMTRGPAAGIYTTREHAEQYASLLAMLEGLEQEFGPDEPIFLSKLLPWGYLAVDNPCGAPTAWRTPLNSVRLAQYYQSHPESIPKLVVVLHPETASSEDFPAANENNCSGWLWEYMEENHYVSRDYSWAQVYISPLASEKETES